MYMNFEYYAPTRVVFGVGAELQTAQLIRRAGGTRVLIVYGGGSAVRSSLIGRIEAALKEQELPFTLLGGVVPNPHLDKVYEGIALGKQLRADFILAVGGVDIIKDDELLSADMPFCPLKERVTKFMEKERQAFEETGEHTLYTVNITTDPTHLRDNAYRALEYGANALMINFYTVGLAGARMITEDPNINVPILAHVDFSGATVASPYWGVDAMTWIGRLSRLAGADMHIWGNPVGKFPSNRLALSRVVHAFTQDWYGIKPTLALPGGGTIPSSVPEILKIMGQDVCLAAGGGVHGHPDGSRAGAKAMRQAIDATINGIGLRQYAETHPELAAALRVWGCGPEELKKNYDLMN